MKVVLSLFLLCLLFPTSSSSRNGGIPCIACTIGVGLVEQLAQFHNETVSQAFSRVCGYLPSGEFRTACLGLTTFFGPVVIELLAMKETPDVICSTISLCYVTPGYKQCHLYPLPIDGIAKRSKKHKPYMEKVLRKHNMLKLPDICQIPGISILCAIFERVEENMLPALDLDNDYFGTIETLRGAAWRGRDCNDLSPYIHPGAKPIDGDRETDSNCNGIYGVDDTTGKTYEELFCAGTGQRGIAVLGDSVSAHFHIPPQWVIPSQMRPEIFTHLAYVVENEIDWPMMSYMTGYKNLTWPIIDGPTRSVYMKLREHNRCSHRDFQNLAVNGADSFNLQSYKLSIARDNVTDNPLLLAIALVGNDVCNKYDDTVAHMTTPKQMYDNLVKTLTFLNERLPTGSHVLMTGEADGRYLYEFMHTRVHPLGHLHKDITYPVLYDYLNCLNISPCSGWMNSNGTIRNETAQRVTGLNKAIVQVAKDFQDKFSQFDVSYIANPVDNVIKEWEQKHGPGSGYELIEPMDGFHPNQFAQALIGDYIWDYVKKNLPHLIGEENPNNLKIKQIFGDQGGY